MLQIKNLCKSTKSAKIFVRLARDPNFAPGEMAERSIAAVLKTVEGQTSGGSNPSLSANQRTRVPPALPGAFFIPGSDASLLAKADRDKKWRT